MLRPLLGLPRRTLRSLVPRPFFETLDVLGLGGSGSSGASKGLRMDVATVEAIVALRLWRGLGGGDQAPFESAVTLVTVETDSVDTVLPERRRDGTVVGGEDRL